MKMKELNTRLSLMGFLQLIFLGSFGGFVAEILKDDRSTWLMIGAICVALITAGTLINEYSKVYQKTVKRKK